MTPALESKEARQESRAGAVRHDIGDPGSARTFSDNAADPK